MRVQLAIPVLNPGRYAKALVAAIREQTLQVDRVVVVDSSSDDGTVAEFQQLHADVVEIPRSEFDHGGTRNLALSRYPADICLFLTQDAIPADRRTFEHLVGALVRHERAGMAYGRQIPHANATPIAAHARLFNYPAESEYRTATDIPRLGIRAAFCSNSFAAYRRVALEEVNGFPERILFGEDTYVAARLLERGWGIGYAADAVVAHSHNYTVEQDFRRYFDLGAFHATERWYTELLGTAGKEGRRFVLSEWRHLRACGESFVLPRILFRNGGRWLGYRAGRAQRWLPAAVKRRIAMNRSYWAAGHRPGEDRIARTARLSAS